MKTSNIYIREMRKKTLSNKIGNSDRLLTLNEYLILARKCISVYAPHIRSGLSTEMLRNEDVVANVANVLMMADYNFDGRGSIGGYRKQCVLFAIKSYIEYKVKAKKRAISTSCFSEIDIRIDGDQKFSNFDPEDGHLGPEGEAIECEKLDAISLSLDKIFNSPILSNIQKDYLRLRYIEGLSVIDIANKYNVSRQGVHDVITRALSKVKESLGNDPRILELVNV